MDHDAPIQLPAALRRRLGLPLLTLYGIGITIGAGIYVLIGAVAAPCRPRRALVLPARSPAPWRSPSAPMPSSPPAIR